MELFCIALKRSKVSVWHARMQDGKIVKGRDQDGAQGIGRNVGASSRQIILPAPVLAPSKCFAERVRQRIPSHGNVSRLETFGISRIIAPLFRNEEDSTMSNPKSRADFPSTHEWIARFCA